MEHGQTEDKSNGKDTNMPRAFWCKHLLADGSQCTMPRVHGSDMCLSHTEGRPYEAKRVANQKAANKRRRKEAEEIAILRKEARKRTTAFSHMQQEIGKLRAEVKAMQDRFDAMSVPASSVTVEPAPAMLAPLANPVPAPTALTPDVIAAIVATVRAMK